ncbi:copper resistance system multicopper oxidase [Alloalcanivorax marinus]|uniref:copper resistance system multicopper oxidase n=1 Tax=Alloalcanivorax marinus TaxID=1177169 RepID=UPI0021D1BA67|nr:copper resistance system multicopper oxidase [Alloalcanivorax marinus]MCU5787791.1 copper resistance protein A [Alloalcanivorax marinus]
MTSSTPSWGRRRFVQGLALGGAALGLGLSPRQLLARQGQTGAAELSGTDFRLTLDSASVNLTGRRRPATLVNGSLPAPTLRWREGDTVTLAVTNHLPDTSSIHWHGLLLPFRMDGVPGLSFDGIAPGDTFTYRFPVKQNGTYWYHSHSGFQEQSGLYGAIVIDPAEPEPHPVDRDYVMVLSDWSDESPDHIYATLKKLSHYYNFNERTVFDTLRDFREKGVAQTLKDRHMWNTMRMSQSDLADVTGYTYTYLLNGHSPSGNWTGLFQPGERVRLRFINASAMTFFDIRIPGLDMTVVAMDGQPVKPVRFHECRLGVAETLDVIVTPEKKQAFTVFAQSIDRSGFARGTLTPDPALRAEVPTMDKPPLLGHTEMGMGAMAGMDHGGMNHGNMNHANMDHGSMSHGAMGHDDMDHGTSHNAADAPVPLASVAGNPDLAPRASATEHLDSEYGPGVDMRAMAPAALLDDPGVGLRERPWKVLTYADLETAGGAPDSPHPDREIVLHLTGNMDRYMWSFNGIKFADAVPLELHHGERARITLVNDTMMTHPIHLHGMWSDLELGDGRLLRKHTVTVKPGEKLSYLVRADAVGRWAYHCHLLYHMQAGMFREVRVVEGPPRHHNGEHQGGHRPGGHRHGGHHS